MVIPAPGPPDVLTLATFAYQVYDTYKGAPKRFKGIRDDIAGLEIILRRLGTKLALHQIDSKAALRPEEALDLERLIKRTGGLLEELQQKQGSAYAPRGLNRFKWSQTAVNSIRGEITSVCGIIAAFNSSLVPSQGSETAISRYADVEVSVLSCRSADNQ